MSFRLSNKFRGFTLIELMVTVGIFVFMTALILSRYNSYYSGTLFVNLAYDIALTLRQAQSYGMSVKVNKPSDTSNFNSSYGVNFDTTDSVTSKKFTLASYIITTPIGFSKQYVLDILEKTYNIKQGAKIQTMCVITSGSTCVTTSKLLIIFQRPNPEAIICKYTVTPDISVCNGKFARITLVANDGITIRNIEVNANGQISVP